MRRICWVLILGILLANLTPSLALEEITLKDVSKGNIELETSPKVIKGSLLINDNQMLEDLVKLQKEKDIEDIELLWKGTVENNKVIAFALKKLATPESQRRIHSSLMSKTLNAIVSGSSFVPSFMGADYAVQTGAFAAGRLAQSLINRKTTPQEIPLTDTEVIELAAMVEDLQDKIIDAYYNYKATLNQIKETRTKLLLYHRNYSKALDSGDILDISISSSLYDEMTLQEYLYVQNAKKYHLELQRLAGKRAVDKLNVYQYNYNASLFKAKGGKS